MSDTCIVCLGDLSTGIDGVAEQSNSRTLVRKSPIPDAATELAADQPTVNGHYAAATTNDNNIAVDANNNELIAHLQPCGHDLHNECLKPWVERANSCPICRASFHLVELMNHVAGIVISSYPVQDKTQVADVDPSLFLEVPDEEDQEDVCQQCGEGDNEDILMYCDGCGKLWHTYCVDLDEVPYASWFCENCSVERATDPQMRYSRRTRAQVGRRRTRGMERRRRNHNAAHDDGWNQVWQSVWSSISLDLDFPFDDDESPATIMRRHRQAVESNRREHEAWERRMRVAELAGAGNRFRETESTLLDNRNVGPHPPVQETPEEMEAWNAFAQAREDSQPQVESSTSHQRKRQRDTVSPAPTSQPHPSPRENKRRRTSTPPTEPQRSARRPRMQLRSSPLRRNSPPPQTRTVLDSAVPSFLQSLLQEVEDSSSGTRIPSHRPSSRYPGSPSAEQQSPRPSSPATSNPSSPRALSATPPPLPNGFRPSSPPGLSSSIQPVFPPASFSPQRSSSPELKEKSPETTREQSRIPPAPDIARPKPRRPRIPIEAVNASRSRSNDTSPTRATLTVDKKADVQKLVSAALKPHYHGQKISKDEYTVINRDVSRMLYDKIGDLDALDLEDRAQWEKVAGEEVTKAVSALRA